MSDQQKTKKCPACNYSNKTDNVLIIKRAESIEEAILLVQYLKTPEDMRGSFENRQNQLSNRTSAKRISKLEILGGLFTQLSTNFKNKIPVSALNLMCKNNGFEETFIEDILEKLYNEGLVMRTKNDEGENIVKFVGLPFKYGKLVVK